MMLAGGSVGGSWNVKFYEGHQRWWRETSRNTYSSQINDTGRSRCQHDKMFVGLNILFPIAEVSGEHRRG